MESWEKKMFEEMWDFVKVKGKNSICSTCKHFNGKSCSKGRPYAGFATKLDDCANWEVCNG